MGCIRYLLESLIVYLVPPSQPSPTGGRSNIKKSPSPKGEGIRFMIFKDIFCNLNACYDFRISLRSFQLRHTSKDKVIPREISDSAVDFPEEVVFE